jgi:hypothetical protein
VTGVVVGLVLGFGVVLGTVFGVVLPLQRAHTDAATRAQVTALKAAALGMGQTVPEVTSVYDPEPEPRRSVARIPARRVDRSVLERGATDAQRDALEPPHPGVKLPREAPPHMRGQESRPFGGW